MPKGVRNTIGNFICQVCSVSFTSMCNHPKYCEICRVSKNKRYWSIFSLDYKRRLRTLLNGARNRANTKKLNFDLDYDYLVHLWEENDGRCALTNRKFDLTQWGFHGQVNPSAPSLDRIIPSSGYVKGNVRLIVYHLNVSLSEYGTEVFEQLARDYLDNGVVAA